MNEDFFTTDERKEFVALYKELKKNTKESISSKDAKEVRRHISNIIANRQIERDTFNLNPVLCAMKTAIIAVNEIGLKRDGVLAILLYNLVLNGYIGNDDVRNDFGESVATIISGIVRIQKLYTKSPAIESENFRNLLLTFAEDMHVILIMIADRVSIMRQIRDAKDIEAQHKVAEEASYLYAPLAHKLGLYKLKSELEDLSLKYLEHDAYYNIKGSLNETKQTRDQYVETFVKPIDNALKNAGLKYHIKARTKSIHSIWQKMKKQKCGFSGIYDLFAIRIILDSPLKKEKMQCWQVYSIVTDMYQPNPKRLRDWLSVPKTNGYESLHITVLGPDNKWVEVQIRTERMDEIAEHGLAAHWRYKGIKSAGGLDSWLADIRTALEAGDDLQVMDQFKLDLYEDEVFVFSPKGDLFRFPKGATILDFAYHIHSKLGNTCVGGKVNGKSVSFRQVLHSGDTIEVTTSNTQKPKREWLNVVKSSHAKSKIRAALKETQIKDGLYAKELLERRFKNRKMVIDESIMAHLIKKLGFKEVSEFYKSIADEKLDINDVIETYIDVRNHDLNLNAPKAAQSAQDFEFESPDEITSKGNDDVLVIDRNLKGIDFTLAQCCHPIYGDPVFGFTTVNGGIKIHREDCPNAPEMRKRFGYRIVKARWSGKGSSQYSITLHIIGTDDIGIVNNITNIISKDEKIIMRSINIDSHDGIFHGNITVMLDDTTKLKALVKKLKDIKGVKQVNRI